LANTVGTPVWVHTNQAEVRKVRMRLLGAYPGLIASQEPPDTDGHYKALSDNMRPVEAAYIAVCLLYQKRYSADFQFTDEEKAQNVKLEPASVNAKHQERTRTFESLVRGQSGSGSIRDFLTAFNHFFDDLGIEQAAKSTTSGSPATMHKGNR
jgi:hypothetical protein